MAKINPMPQNCPICDQETAPETTIRGSTRVTNYVCENCKIVWYLDTGGKMKITVSGTHSRASKLSDEDFEILMKRISDYEKS
jgi:transposase-like protein